VNGAVTYLYGVNNGGYLTGYYISPETGLYTGFLTSPTGVLTSFQYASNVGTMPTAINNKNVVVGSYYTSGNQYHGFVRSSDGTMQDLLYPGSVDTLAAGINDAGEVVGVYEVESVPRDFGFLYSSGQYVPFLSGQALNAVTGINNSGQIVGSYNDSSLNSVGFIATPVPACAPSVFICGH
jgi:uncharacterized membrane protein